MVEPFIIKALAAGIGVAIVAGPLGCFVVWRKMAYFGDSLAHSALLGIVLGLVFGISLNLSTLLVCSFFAIALVWLQHKHILANDTLLGILAHAALSIGLVALSFVDNPRFDLHSYLFGNILTVQTSDLYWIYAGGLVTLSILVSQWPALILLSIDTDLAKAEGVNTFWQNLVLMAMMTLVVAISLRIVGILLITSMLIIPAATAQQWARSPIMMAVLASLIGVVAVVGGLIASAYIDTPSGPSIVSVAAGLFLVGFLLAQQVRR